MKGSPRGTLGALRFGMRTEPVRQRPRSGSSFLFVVGLLFVEGACGGTSGTLISSDPVDGGADASTSSEGGVANPPGCPASLPPSASVCTLARGVKCQYGTVQCGGGAIAECVGGRWSVQQPGAPAPTCPENAPTEGAACCLAEGARCSFDCAHGGGVNRVATCSGGTWKVDALLSPCTANDVPCTPGQTTCAAGTQCLCCGSAGPRQTCVCTTACAGTGDTQCTSADRPTCNRRRGGDPGICTSPNFNCCWDCQ
jgi:hypothetical protein